MTIVLLMLKIFLDASYVFVLYHNYAYAGFTLSPSFLTVSVGILLFLPVAFLMPKRLEKPSDFLLFVLVLLMYLPTTTMYGFGGISLLWTFTNMLFWIAVLAGCRILPDIKLPSGKPEFSFFAICVIFWAFFAYVIITAVKYTGFTIYDLTFNLSNVYERRAAYKSANIPYAGYFYNWAGNVIFPASCVYFITRRKWFMTFFAILGELILFSVTGFKTMLMACALVFVFALLTKIKRRFEFLLIVIFAAFIGSVLIYILFGNIVPYSLIVRRALFLPVQISQHFYEFFGRNGYVRLAHSILSGIYSYPFAEEPPQLIGTMYYIAGETSANAGIIADGFANFGFIGVALWAAIFILILRLADSAGKGKNLVNVLACFGLFSATFSNSALITSLSTHGFWAALVFAMILPKENKTALNKAEIIYKKAV